MALANYTDLAAEIGNYLDRDDLAPRIPTFVRMAEARLNRLLSDPDMEAVTTTTATSNATALPADFGAMVSISDGIGRPLKQMGSQEFASIDRTIGGEPRFYVVEDGAISFAPANATAEIRLVYRRTIPALTATNPTNWLLERAPDVYLYGALVQASAFLSDSDMIGLWKSAFDEAIDELRSDAVRRKWGAGPASARIKRP